MNEWNHEIQNENEVQAAISASRAENLGKWLGVLFWLVIPGIAGSLLSNEAVVSWLPFLYMPGRIIGMVTMCVYGYILLKLSSESGRYRMAALCCLASAAVDAGSSLIPKDVSLAGLIGLLVFPMLILSLYGEYSEYMGHSEILQMPDEEMSVKWKRLWRWYIYSLGVMTGSVLLVMLSPVLGITALLVGTIGVLIAGVIKLIYLYRTAKIFREYAAERKQQEI